LASSARMLSPVTSRTVSRSLAAAAVIGLLKMRSRLENQVMVVSL
jgi:hypothetical protein